MQESLNTRRESFPTSNKPASFARAAAVPLKYRADIDGMRAVAVLLVLVFHFSLVKINLAGFLGVDIFFVISGFLITTILTRQLDTGTLSLRTFYVNRIRRLAPALLAVLLLVISASWIWLFPNDLVEVSNQILSSQSYTANIYFWRNINYFGLGAHDVYLLHMWSLAVEEQFYLIYPACILLLYRNLKGHFWTVIILGYLISFSLNVFFVGQKPEATFYLLPTRGWELLTGALVSRAACDWDPGRYINEILGLLGVALIAIGVAFFRADFNFPGFFALWPVMGAACLLLSGQRQTTGASRVLSWKPIVYIGKISYSMYLVHWPINVFAELLIKDYSLAWRLAMFVLSILMAAFVYHAVEDPIRSRRFLAKDRKLLLAYIAGIAASLSLFVVVHTTRGVPERFPSEVVRLADHVNDRTASMPECQFRGQPLSYSNLCRIGTSSATPTWLVYGDSHAWAAHAAFDEWLKLNGQAGLFIFMHSCPPLNGIHLFRDKDNCFAFNRAVTHLIEERPDLSKIVLVSIWRQAAEGLLSVSSETLPTKEQSLQLFSDGFSRTVQHLHDLGRQVFIWEPVPGAHGSVPAGLARAVLQHRPADLEMTVDEYFARNQFFFDALKMNRKWIEGSFSPSKALCQSGKCIVEYNGNPLYADNNHISSSTVDFWVRVLQDGMHSR